MTKGRVGVWNGPKKDDVIYEQPLRAYCLLYYPPLNTYFQLILQGSKAQNCKLKNHVNIRILQPCLLHNLTQAARKHLVWSFSSEQCLWESARLTPSSCFYVVSNAILSCKNFKTRVNFLKIILKSCKSMGQTFIFDYFDPLSMRCSLNLQLRSAHEKPQQPNRFDSLTDTDRAMKEARFVLL